METRFTPEQLSTSPIKAVNTILRKCVHCGFCTATCPTYVLLGDELDSPRGRIYLIRDLLENPKKPSSHAVKHLDRCLSCLSCMTTCPSGVDYMHLVDHARAQIESHYRRPLADRLLRELLARVLPNPKLFRLSLWAAKLVRPLNAYMPGRLRTLMAMAPEHIKPEGSSAHPGVVPAVGETKRRVALMPGCAQQVLNPAINEATVRVLTRLGCEVVVADGGGCCGALVHHMGREAAAQEQARINVGAWMAEISAGGLDAIVINASGCGTTVKDYGHMLKDDPEWAKPAATVSALARDVTEVLSDIGIETFKAFERPGVAYHSACSMQHGQKLKLEPVQLLKRAGFDVSEPAEAHLCCGSAGTYNIMQPALASQLGQRKAKNLHAVKAEVIATGNIGCMEQLATHSHLPVVHTVELLDWATGGPKPDKL